MLPAPFVALDSRAIRLEQPNFATVSVAPFLIVPVSCATGQAGWLWASMESGTWSEPAAQHRSKRRCCALGDRQLQITAMMVLTVGARTPIEISHDSFDVRCLVCDVGNDFLASGEQSSTTTVGVVGNPLVDG